MPATLDMSRRQRRRDRPAEGETARSIPMPERSPSSMGEIKNLDMPENVTMVFQLRKRSESGAQSGRQDRSKRPASRGKYTSHRGCRSSNRRNADEDQLLQLHSGTFIIKWIDQIDQIVGSFRSDPRFTLNEVVVHFRERHVRESRTPVETICVSSGFVIAAVSRSAHFCVAIANRFSGKLPIEGIHLLRSDDADSIDPLRIGFW